MNNGYIKLYRKTLENPVVIKDSAHLSVWIYLLLNATHKEMPAMFKGKKIILKPGQLLIGSKSIGEKLNINYVKIHRIINEFENEKQIEKQTSNKNTLITIINWELYQDNEKQNEIQTKNKCNSTENKQECNKSYYYHLEKIIGPILTPFICEKVDDLVRVYGGDMFIASVKNAAMNNVKNLNYIEATLRNWKAEGKVHIQNPKQIDEETEPNEIFEYDWLNEGENG